MCFFLPHKECPEKTHKQIFGTHPVPGQSRENFVYVFFSLCFFSLPSKGRAGLQEKTKLHGGEFAEVWW